MTGDSLAKPLSADEENALLDALRDVIRALGVERVLTRPVVLPDEKHFPDPWSATSLGVARLARRLMRFAGVDADVAVIATSEELVEEKAGTPSFRGSTWRTVGSPISFAGVSSSAETACVFAVDARHLDDPDFVVGAAAREVAKAVRALEGCIVADNAALEDKFVDVTGAALGFGVLFANDALRIRSRGEIRGRTLISEHKKTEAGSLGPRASSFLLGAIVAARGLDERPLKAALETNQAAWLADAVKRLARPDVDIGARLGLPPSSKASAAVNLQALLAPLPDGGIYADDVDLEPEGAAHGVHEEPRDASPGPNAGRPIFRVAHTMAGPLTAVAAFAGLLVSLGAATNGLGWIAFAIIAAPAALSGFVFGKTRKFDFCADPQCKSEIPLDAATCPGCGGFVAGYAKNPNDRLAAEERWRKEQRR